MKETKVELRVTAEGGVEGKVTTYFDDPILYEWVRREEESTLRMLRLFICFKIKRWYGLEGIL